MPFASHLQNVPDELFLEILDRVTWGRTLAQVIYLRLVCRRFRDILISFYVRGDRLLETLITRQPAALDYANLNQFPCAVAVDLLQHWWNEPTFVDPSFARHVELLELRMCVLIPSLSRESVHRKFCEMFARRSSIFRGQNSRIHRTGEAKGTWLAPTVRMTFLRFTQTLMKDVKPDSLYSQDADSIGPGPADGRYSSLEHWLRNELWDQPVHFQKSDMAAWCCMLAFGYITSRAEREKLIRFLTDKSVRGRKPDTERPSIKDTIIRHNPIVLGALMGREELVQEILEQPDLLPNDHAIAMALSAAAYNDHPRIVGTLLRNDAARNSVLHLLRSGTLGVAEACHSRSLASVQLLIPFLQSNADSPPRPASSLRSASTAEYDQSTRLLTEILRYACSCGSSDAIVTYLVMQGAHIDGMPNRSPLDYFRAPSLLSRISEGGSHGLSLGLAEGTAVSYAARNGFPRLVRTLVRLGADPTLDRSLVPILDQNSGLLYYDDVHLLHAMAELGFDVASPKAMLLPQAARRGAVGIVAWLLDNFPERVWADKGDLAIFQATVNGHVGILRLLLKHGEEVDKFSPHGLVEAFVVAANKRMAEVVVVLLSYAVRGRERKQEIEKDVATTFWRERGTVEMPWSRIEKYGDFIDECLGTTCALNDSDP